MLAEGTDGLYRRAIMQSDPLGTLDGRDDMERKILDELNELPVDASLDEIRSAQIRITANVIEKSNAKYMIFGPHFGVHPLPAKSQMAARIRQAAPSLNWGLGRSPIGACHAMDCVPLFGLRGGADVPMAMGYTEEDVRRQGLPMRRIWADFAKTGAVTSSGVEGMIEIANWTK